MRSELSHKPLNMHWRLTWHLVKALRKTHCLPPADKTSLWPGAGNEEKVPAGNQQGNCKQHRIISSLQFYPPCCGFFVNSMSSCLEKPRRLLPTHGHSGFHWAWSLPEVTTLLTDHGVPIKLLYSSVASGASVTCSSIDEMNLAVHSHAFRMLTGRNDQSKTVAK